jgi:hypothetical protein
MKVYVPSAILLAAMLTVACDGEQNSFNPTAPSATGSGGNASSGGDGCTPPDGADTYFEPAPSGSTLPPGEPSCDTATGGDGPSTSTGGSGTPPDPGSIPPPRRRPGS